MVEKETVLEGYDEIAETYLGERSPSSEEQQALSSFLDELAPASRLLDAGCGGGEPVLRSLTTASHDVVGVDLSGEQLRIAASKAPEAKLLRGDMTRLPVADGSVDAVLAFHSLIHVPSG